MNLLLLVVLCFGQVTISDRLPPPVKYPAAVYDMTDDQFFQWATEFNVKQEADLEKRREKMTEPQYLFGMETVTDQNWDGNHGSQVYTGYDSYGPYSQHIGGDYYGNANRSTVTYPRRWHNPYYTGPGPLVIVNPYCRPSK